MRVEVTDEEARIIRTILDRESDPIICMFDITYGRLADLIARFEETVTPKIQSAQTNTARTATFMRKLDRDTDDIDARLYRLSAPMSRWDWSTDDTVSSEYVVVSGSKIPALGRSETYIFLADESGEITNLTECDGSFQGAIDHAQALRNAGYEIIGED